MCESFIFNMYKNSHTHTHRDFHQVKKKNCRLLSGFVLIAFLSPFGSIQLQKKKKKKLIISNISLIHTITKLICTLTFFLGLSSDTRWSSCGIFYCSPYTGLCLRRWNPEWADHSAGSASGPGKSPFTKALIPPHGNNQWQKILSHLTERKEKNHAARTAGSC